MDVRTSGFYPWIHKLISQLQISRGSLRLMKRLNPRTRGRLTQMLARKTMHQTLRRLRTGRILMRAQRKVLG